MALLSLKARKARFKYLGLGEYNKQNILKFQKKAFPGNKKMQDGLYGENTDNALRTFYNVKKFAPNFTPQEFKCDCGGRHCSGYPSFMKQVELKNLQAIRDHYKRPMVVTCGLRCRGYNAECRGSIINSAHLSGYATDFYMQGVTDTYANRRSSINWMKKLPYTHYVYGNGINSNGYAVSAPYMGNAMHYETSKPPAKKKSITKKTTTKKTTTKKVSPYYNKTTLIGQACCNERGTLSGGKVGDQTGRELCISNWSASYGWLYVFRCKDASKREKIAQYCMDACNNQNIGYNIDIPARYGAWDNAEANGHNIKGIKKKGDSTCSQLVSMVLRAVGISKTYARRHYDIATMTAYLPKCPDFTMYTAKSFTQSTQRLLPGDILLSSHHTAIVVKSPNAK